MGKQERSGGEDMRAGLVCAAMLPILVAVVAVPLASLGPKEYNDFAAGPIRNGTSEGLKLKVEPFEWAMCGEPTDALQVTKADLTPYPIKFSKDRGMPLNLALTGNLSRDVTAGTYDMVLKKKVPYIDSWQKIPCINGYGSCSVDLCEGCNSIFGPVCDKWFQDNNLPCHCPFLAQQFSVAPQTLILPAAGPVPAWLADGDFQVQLTFRDQAGAQVGCVFIQMSLLIVK